MVAALFYSAENGNCRQHITDKHTAGIAHENACRVKVVADKADDAAGKCSCNNGNRVKALLAGQQE